jgi:ferrous iron transport protein B
MEQICSLDTLEEGECAVLREVAADHPLYQRLIDLGFVAGTTISCERVSPLGDPVAYGLRGSVIALRREDARLIEIEKMNGEYPDKENSGCDTAGIIALAGNPNVGKSTLFNAMTGLHQHTGNWTGKTVACAEGQFRHAGRKYRLIDLPGTYSMTPHAGEEEVARDALIEGRVDAVGVVCDAGALERNLILVLQIMQSVDRPVALILNLQREARRRGVKVSAETLERELGIPVVETEAREGEGIPGVAAVLAELCKGRDAQKDRLLTPHGPPVPPELLARMASDITARVSQREASAGAERDRKLDHLLTGRLSGFPVMLCLLALVFWITLVGANGLSDHLMALFSWSEGLLLAAMSGIGAPEWLTSALVLGVFRTVGWVVSVMLPPMAIFFPLFTLLEDLGYLPRIAFNLDRGFCRCHSCGKQALTMCMGLGCNAVGVTGCRIIDSPRERRIAMLTNSMMPCNGRFPTWIALVGLFMVSGGGVMGSLSSALIIVCGIVLCVAITMLTSRFLSATLLRGTASSFVLELPPYRMPRVGRVILRSVLDRTLLVLGRALAVAAPAGLVLWLMANIHVGDATLLVTLSSFLDPLGRLLGMDGAILLAFILSLPANEIFLPIVLMIYRGGAVLEPLGNLGGVRDILVAQGWSVTTALCVMLFLLFHWPCATTLLTIKREGGGWKWTLLGAMIPTAVGAVLCLAVAGVARLFGFS